MIFLFQHPERREGRENTGTHGLYEWAARGLRRLMAFHLAASPATAFYPL